MPGSVLRRAPRAWWEDVAFLVTHLGWRQWNDWPVSFGYLVEWRIWPSLDKRYMTRQRLRAYLDAEWERGEDVAWGQLDAESLVPLPEGE